MEPQEITNKVKTYILKEFLPGEDPAALTADTEMATTGVLDSIAVINVVTFLEKTFGISLEAHETAVENINTLNDITRLVSSKMA